MRPNYSRKKSRPNARKKSMKKNIRNGGTDKKRKKSTKSPRSSPPSSLVLSPPTPTSSSLILPPPPPIGYVPKKTKIYKEDDFTKKVDINTIIQTTIPMPITIIELNHCTSNPQTTSAVMSEQSHTDCTLKMHNGLSQINKYLFTTYITGYIEEERVITLRSVIILQNNPNITWPTPNIAFYRSSGTSRENGDYRTGTFFPFYGFGYAINELDEDGNPMHNEKFLKMSDCKKPSSSYSIRELELLEIEFNEWLKENISITTSIRQNTLYEISFQTIQIYFANIWQIYCSISLSLKKDLLLHEFSLDPAFLNAHFHTCVWISTSPVNYLFFLEFFIRRLAMNGITMIPALPLHLHSDINRMDSELTAHIYERVKDERIEENNYDELKVIMNENRASVEMEDLKDPKFLTFMKYKYKV